MKISTFLRIVVLLFLFIGSSNKFRAQEWQYGQYMNEQIATSAMTFYALGGCFPSSDVQWSFTLPEVSGVSFYLICTSADPMSSYINPGNDTLAVGDTIALVSGGNSFALYYFSGEAATMPVLFDLYAEGTPTQDGEPCPCSDFELLWMSNLMFCPEQQSATLPTDCTVGLGINVEEEIGSSLQIISPSEVNNFTLRFKNPNTSDRIQIFNASGALVMETPKNVRNVIDCSSLASGIYIVCVRDENGMVSSTRMSIAK